MENNKNTKKNTINQKEMNKLAMELAFSFGPRRGYQGNKAHTAEKGRRTHNY